MGHDFSFRSFLLHLLLHPTRAFIADAHEELWDNPDYYALLEDRKGSHFPLPRAPRIIQWIYGKLKPRLQRRRGFNFFWVCPMCMGKSYFSYRGSYCRHCGTEFDRDGNAILSRGPVGDINPIKVKQRTTDELQLSLEDFEGSQ